MLQLVEAIFFLLVVHALMDFPLQGDSVAINKNPNANTDLQKHVPWYYWMGAHALAHGGGVALVMSFIWAPGAVWLGLSETVCHFLIDCGKCNKKYSIHGDQVLHVLCKLLWVAIWLIVN
jgi:hypothetical protein